MAKHEEHGLVCLGAMCPWRMPKVCSAHPRGRPQLPLPPPPLRLLVPTTIQRFPKLPTDSLPPNAPTLQKYRAIPYILTVWLRGVGRDNYYRRCLTIGNRESKRAHRYRGLEAVTSEQRAKAATAAARYL